MGFLFSGLEEEKYDRQYSDITLIKKIWFFVKAYKRWIIISSFFILISTVTNIILPQMLTDGIDSLLAKNSFNSVVIYAFMYLFLGIIFFLSEFVRSYSNIKFTSYGVRDIRNILFAKVLRYDQSFYDENRTGRIISRIGDDTEQMDDFLSLSSQFISYLVITVATFIVLLTISVQLTILGLFVIPFLLLVTYVFRSVVRKVTKEWRKSYSTVNQTFQEGMSGISVAKGFARISRTQEKFLEINERNYKIGVKRGVFVGSIFPFIDILSVIGLFVVLYFGVANWTVGELSAGSVLLFLIYLDRFYFPIIFIANYYQVFQSGLAATERVFSLLDVEPLVVDPDEDKRNFIETRLNGEIEFKNVNFSYIPGQPVLKNYSLKIYPREKVAIVGHTGAGKTTITSLLLRLYDINSGSLLIDGKPINSFNISEYRSQLAIVFQEPYLYDTTIADNIRYGKPDTTIDEIINVCTLIHANSFIQNLPEGYDTVVGERGNKLSFGQRQLIAFARALIINPAILLLDEATANVDAYTEYLIQDAIDTILKDRTSIIIAHRLTTVLNADRIIVMDHGQIIEEGNHHELLKQNGHYSDLYNTYFKFQSADWEPEYENNKN